MSGPWLSVLTLATSVAVGFALFRPRVLHSERWHATVTPLASIIGSGFLVLGPILLHQYGRWAPALMLALCGTAYLYGAVIRFNIAQVEPLLESGDLWSLPDKLEQAGSWTLAGAYVVSVAYYLNLLGSFSVSLTPADTPVFARLVTTACFLFIGLWGALRGLRKLEALEQGWVTVKLAIIAGLLLALVIFAVRAIADGTVAENPPSPWGLHSLFVAFGLVITVQGFETSRYLGDEHSAEVRIRTMKLAQWSSSAIYLVYVAAMTWAFDASDVGTTETAIIGVTAVVAPVLPLMLVGAAVAAQFSAAVADTAGCGGLVEELSRGKIPPTVGYLVIAGVGLLLTWTTNVFELIAYASRAFAVYYALQSLLAASVAWRQESRMRALGFLALGLLGAAIAVFGVAVE